MHEVIEKGRKSKNEMNKVLRVLSSGREVENEVEEGE